MAKVILTNSSGDINEDLLLRENLTEDAAHTVANNYNNKYAGCDHAYVARVVNDAYQLLHGVSEL